MPASYALAQLKVRGGPVFVFVLLIVQMIPGIVMANSLYTVFSNLALIDNYLGLVLADSTATIPFAVLLLRAFMISIPRELTEASRVDGAGYWRTFFSIIVPVSRNALVTAGLFSFLFAWADFLFAVTLTTGQTFEPITVGIYRFVGNQSADWNGIMATAALASIPAAVLLVIAQRYVVAGMTSGAVKD
jgi:multiple sugar transport system permease protein